MLGVESREEDSEDYDSQEDEVYEGLDSDEDLEDEFLPPKKSTGFKCTNSLVNLPNLILFYFLYFSCY